MEKYLWGLDISTSVIGNSLFNMEGKLIEMKHLELKIDRKTPVEFRELHKAQMFCEYVAEYKKHVLNDLNGEITHIAVEEPIGGSNNAFTVSKLFSFNGISRYILFKEFGIIPQQISVYDSRRLFLREYVKTKKEKGIMVEVLSFPKGWKSAEKKQCVWDKVSKIEPMIEWFYDKNKKLKNINFDMSDSYAVSHAYLKILGILK